ncbi:MAG: glycoside hydrolase family 15 protein [archaeon]
MTDTKMNLDHRHARKLREKSIEVLNELQNKNGGCFASPPGARYPYVYPRDLAIVILGFIEAGLMDRAKSALSFVFRSQRSDGAFPQRLDAEGGDASYKPVQLDSVGLILIAFACYARATRDGRAISRWWSKAERGVKYLRAQHDPAGSGLLISMNSIHEFPPIERGFEAWANACAWAALTELAALGDHLGRRRPSWVHAAEQIKVGVEKRMWNPRFKTFVKVIRLREENSVHIGPDASVYALADFGMFSDDDPRIVSTVKLIEKKLWHPTLGGLCRYPEWVGRNNGGWGPWPHFTLMLCRHFIRRGDKARAVKYLDWVLSVADRNLLPEHISTVKDFSAYVTDYTSAGLLRQDRSVLVRNALKHPAYKKGIAYVTLPLGWPHAEFIITYALFRKRFG